MRKGLGMSYIFDPSSIYTAVETKKVGVLGENYAALLAKLELGNIGGGISA